MVACKTSEPGSAPAKTSAKHAASVATTATGPGESSAPNPPSVTTGDASDSWPGAGVSVVDVSVKCKPTTKPGFKTTGNARFAFCLDVPNHWREGEQSGNGDGSDLVVEGAESVSFFGFNMQEFRIASDGGLTVNLAAEYERRRTLGGVPGTLSPLRFDDGMSGKAIRQKDENWYLRPASDHFAVLYVKANAAWLRVHEAEVLAVARSLRDGEQREDPR
jgi:hypothetical protein